MASVSPAIFLYTGAEIGERNDAISQFRSSVEKKLGECDFHLLYAGDTSVSQVVSLLQNGSLFASARFVVLRNAELIKKKEDIDLLGQWVKLSASQPEQDAFLFLVSDETSVDKKLDALVPKDNKRIFWEMFEDRKAQWVTGFFRKNGYSIEPETAEVILDMVENNTESLRSECSRFFLIFDKSHLITPEDAESILVHNREENAFSLFGAMVESSGGTALQLERCLSILQKIRQSKDNNSVSLLALLASCFRKLKTWHSLMEENPHPSAFDFKKSGFSTQKMQSQYRSAAKNWSSRHADLILNAISETDMSIRQTGSGTEDFLLQSLIYTIVVRKGAPLAQYSCPDF